MARLCVMRLRAVELLIVPYLQVDDRIHESAEFFTEPRGFDSHLQLNQKKSHPWQEWQTRRKDSATGTMSMEIKGELNLSDKN